MAGDVLNREGGSRSKVETAQGRAACPKWMAVHGAMVPFIMIMNTDASIDVSVTRIDHAVPARAT